MSLTKKNAELDEFQLGFDSYYEDWPQEKINSVLVNCIDTQRFYEGRQVAEEQNT